MRMMLMSVMASEIWSVQGITRNLSALLVVHALIFENCGNCEHDGPRIVEEGCWPLVVGCRRGGGGAWPGRHGSEAVVAAGRQGSSLCKNDEGNLTKLFIKISDAGK